MTYPSGERDVDKAFQTINHSRRLADASRDFKIAEAATRIAVKDFAVLGWRRPAQATARNWQQDRVNENMTSLADAAAKKLMIALLAMRNHEAEYRLNPRLLTRHQFLATYQQFAQTFDSVDGIPEMEMKQKFQSEVKDRANTFVQWIQVSDTIHRGDPGGSGPRPGRTQFYDFADHAANQALGGGHAGQAARGLDEARNELERTQQATDTMSTEAQTAEQRVGAASDNVTATASSLDEVAASIGEIATQAAKSIDVAGRPVSQAQRTVATMSELANAATRIGEVIGLI